MSLTPLSEVEEREGISICLYFPDVYTWSLPPTFQNSIQAVDVTGNADCPENGLEALAQVVSCENIIGWRSRDATGIDRGLTRIVLFLTDEQFHYSGEGRVSFLITAMYWIIHLISHTGVLL